MLIRLLLSSLLYGFVHTFQAPAIGNFAISSSSCYFENVVVNPPIFSTYLAEVARDAELLFSIDGGRSVDASELFGPARGVFPECVSEARLSGLRISFQGIAPLSPSDAETGFLPVIIGRFTMSLLTSDSPRRARNLTISYRLWCGDDAGSRAACGADAPLSGGYSWLSGGAINATSPLFVAASGGTAVGADCGSRSDIESPRGRPTMCATLTLEVSPEAASSEGIIVIGHHTDAGRHASRKLPPGNDDGTSVRKLYPSARSLFDFISLSYPVLFASHAAFIAVIPTSGNKSIDEAARWWLQASIILTKGIGDRVLTMGYVELNARDSFWTTFLHAYTWPSLEATMLREMCEFACGPDGGPPSYCQGGASVHGKIPTCILPTIVRDDNIDITAFFVMRLARYMEATGDELLLSELYPCLRSALMYLIRRVPEGGALPAARNDSYWGSWEDVPFLLGRKTMVDNAALYLASLRTGSQSAMLLASRREKGAERDAFRDDSRVFSRAYSAGHRELLAPVAAGGLWDSSIGYFRDSWHSGAPSNYTLGDVFMTVFFSILGEDRARKTIDFIKSPKMSGEFGVRALYPYMPFALDPWGGYYPPGVYANGGSYAWLTCGAALAAHASGSSEWAWHMWHAHTDRMLFHNNGPRVPYEYLHSETGERMGNAPQGWSSVCSAFAWRGPTVGWTRASPIWAQRRQVPLVDPTEEGRPFSIDEPGVSHLHTYHLTISGGAARVFVLPCGSIPGAFIEIRYGGGVVQTQARLVRDIRSTDKLGESFAWGDSVSCEGAQNLDGSQFFSCVHDELRVIRVNVI